MDPVSWRMKVARLTILAYLGTSRRFVGYDDLQSMTGLDDSQLDLVLQDLMDSHEIEDYVTACGVVQYASLSIQNRVGSWQLKKYEPSNVLTLDVETTGLKARCDDVLQLAIVELDGDCRLNEFYGSTKPDWPEAAKINRITPEMVNGLQRLCECPDVATDALKDAKVLCGYNLAFD